MRVISRLIKVMRDLTSLDILKKVQEPSYFFKLSKWQTFIRFL